MKTHDEIREAIDVFRRHTRDNANADILDALNERMSRLEEATRACLDQLEMKHDALNDRIAELEKRTVTSESKVKITSWRGAKP